MFNSKLLIHPAEIHPAVLFDVIHQRLLFFYDCINVFNYFRHFLFFKAHQSVFITDENISRTDDASTDIDRYVYFAGTVFIGSVWTGSDCKDRES